MRLKELEIQGFKSFPDKTRITIGEGITGVVGPNGSGKSNISDSIRWVLGETSSKQLRGAGKMEDVIFGGTQTRGAMGYAAVSLTIDNSDHGLEMDADEVTIGRRYYRSGESEYTINGQSVRLKDVYELLLDTGLGRDGYAIVGQGRIAEIVGAKSTERREIFEEASGIAKYRYRKNEAERRLAAAEGNLERLRDILGELEKRVGPLKRDSEKAEQFLAYSETRKGLEITLWVDSIRRAQDTVRDQQRKYEAAESDYARISCQLDEFDTRTEALRAEAQQLMLQVEEANAEIRTITEQNAGSESQLAVLQNETEHANEQIRSASDELTRAGEGAKGIAQEADEHKAEITQLQTVLQNLDAEADKLRQQLNTLEQQALQSGERREIVSAAMARMQQNATALQVRGAGLQSAVEAARAQLNGLKNQEAAAGDVAQKLTEERDAAAEHLKECEEAVTRNDNIRSGLKLKLESRRRQQAEAAEALQKAAADKNNTAQRIRILEDLERNMDGYQQSVKAVMRAAGGGRLRGIIGPVAGILSVRKGYEIAIETALGFALQNIVVEDQGCARAAIGFLKDERAGRATFLPLDTVQGSRFTGRLTGTAEVAADLQRRALTSRAAARQMREERGEEDGGNEQDRQLAALMHRVEHRVGAHALRAQEAVERDDQHARERQRIKQRRDLRPQLGGVLHAEVKERADRAADRADERSGQQPFDQRFHIQHHMVGKPLQLLHRPFPFPSHFFTAISHRLNKVILHESTEKSSGEKAHRFIR